MLQYIRDLTAGWLALVVLGLFCVPFVFWGVNLYFGDPPDPVVAKIGERELTRDALRAAAERYRSELGASELSTSMRDEALDRMIDGGLILEYTEGYRMRIGDKPLGEEIARLFGGEDFDLQDYQDWLNQRRLTGPAFENQVRQEMLSRQLREAVTSSVFLLDDELRRLARAELQQRDFSYIRIGVDEEAAEEPGAEAIGAYYDTHQEEYRLPERVRVAYLELTLEEVADQLEVNEEELRNFYEGRVPDYDIEEARKFTSISLPIPEESPEREAADALMQRLLARAVAGEELEVLVMEEDAEATAEDVDTTTPAADEDNADTGDELVSTAGESEEGAIADSSTDTDAEATIDAGLEEEKERELMGILELVSREFTTRGELPVDQADEVYSLAEPGELSAVLTDAAGLRILRLDEIKQGRVSTFENSRADAERDYREVEAERRFIEQAERLGTLAFESPSSLEPAAEALGLEILESAPFSMDRGEAEELSMDAKVRVAAFSEAVLEAEENSPLLELGDDRVVVLRVQERIPESLQPLTDVEEQVTRALKRKTAIDTAQERGENALEQLNAGVDKDTVSAELELEWEEHEAVTRDNRELLRAALREAFRMPVPESDTSPVYSGSKLGNGDYLLVILTAVRDVEDDTEITQEKLDELHERLSSARYLVEWREFLHQVRESSKVEIYNEQVEKSHASLIQ